MIATTPSVQVFWVAKRYLEHQLDLRALHDWLVRHTSWFMTAPEDDGTQLAAAIELTIAEIAAGHATEEDLRRDISELLSAKTMHFCLSSRAAVASSSSVTKPGVWTAGRWSASDKQAAAVSA